MLEWFRAWSKGIVIAVIIATLIELILPENSSKKYIKIIIGIFIVYTIISPAITKFTGKNFDGNLQINDVIETSSKLVENRNLAIKTEDSVKKIYIQNLQNDVKNKLKEKGYIAENVIVKIADDDSYNITNIHITISDKIEVSEDKKETQTIVDTIKTIKVKLGNSSNEQGSGLANENDKNVIRKIIKENYGVDNVTIT